MANILAATKRAGLTGEDAVRALGRAARPVTSYGDVGVEDGDNGLVVGRSPAFGNATYVGQAFIVEKPAGGAGFTDCRYWINPISPVATSDGRGIRAFGTAPDLDSVSCLVGTNLAEVDPASAPTGTDPVKGSHLVDVGTPVALLLMVDDLGNERYVFNLPVQAFDAIVVSSTQDGTNYRWTYSVKKAVKTAAAWGGWQAADGATALTAYNTIEAINGPSATVYGDGITEANRPSTVDLQPVPPDVVVRAWPQLVTISGTPSIEYWFQYESGADGPCPDPGPGDGGTP